MRSTAKGLRHQWPWRGLPLMAALLMLGAAVGFVACDDTGPSPIGDHAPDDVDSGSAEPAEDAAPEASGDDDDGGDDAGEGGGGDAGDAGDAGKKDGGDAGKDADAHA